MLLAGYEFAVRNCKIYNRLSFLVSEDKIIEILYHHNDSCRYFSLEFKYFRLVMVKVCCCKLVLHIGNSYTDSIS